ncbi:hypothetical protein, conserved [Eimeria praecox]|uniref:Dynein axonemal assembly factor 5 TPR repeats domain-containing protein n=1 Tax=Eimeria praecox TaxID=51316 RepID=U6G5P7_9EIME|nr:hypothetical protein, conserved [Eimeria praecox]
MATPQVLANSFQTLQQQQQQLLHLLRRDLNRLTESNRVTRLQGARAILRVYEQEATRRAARSDQTTTSSNSSDGPKEARYYSQCAFSGVFLSNVYPAVSVLCADDASESCRATALDLIQLVVKKFLSRQAAKPLVAIIAERLKEGSEEVEKSEELRFTSMQFLQELILEYAADPPPPKPNGDQHTKLQASILLDERGWDATEFADCLLAGVAGALKDKSPSNAIEACRLLSAISQKLEVSVLLQSCKKLLERLLGCLTRPQRAVRWALRRLVQGMSPRVLLRQDVMPHLLQLFLHLMGDAEQTVSQEADKALHSVAPRCVFLSRRRQQRRKWKKGRARDQPQKLSSEEDGLASSATSSSEDFLEENDDEGPHTSPSPLSATCKTDGENSVLYKSMSCPGQPATELAGLHLKDLMADLLPRLTSWSADERLASLRALSALMPISGFRLLHELPHLLLQLYGTCAIGEGVPLGTRKDEQQQWSPLLLLVQHAILREISSKCIADSDCNGSNVVEPWHRGGLQELGVCSALCNALEAVELALQCTGQVALLLPPCSWLPLIATHLGLQKEVHLYIKDKEKALAAGVAEGTEEKISICSDVASQEEKEFLHRFAGGYRFVVDTLGLNSPKYIRSQQRTTQASTAGKSPSVVAYMCSSESRKQALLLLARLLRGLRPHNERGGTPQERTQHELMGEAKAAQQRVYGLGKEEVWLLVRIIEQAQGAEYGSDNDETMPFTAALLLQLLRAAGELCQMEAKSLFAAALLQQIDTRSHPDITREAVQHFALLTMSCSSYPNVSVLGLSVIRSSSRRLVHSACRQPCGFCYGCNGFCGRALHGAQEAADAEESPQAPNCLRMWDLVKVALLCVSQIIPTLSVNTVPPISLHHQETEEACESQSEENSSGVRTRGQLPPGNEGRNQLEADMEETNEKDVNAKPIVAALSLLSPLLISCMDDDWNADVRSLAVGVVRQLFLDLHGDKEQHAALQQLATAVASPLQQRLDDARDDIRLAAAVALQAMLKQRPSIVHRSTANEIYKSLCICLDDRNESLATAAEAALLAGADDLKLAALEELQGTEPSSLYPERYRKIRQKLLELPGFEPAFYEFQPAGYAAAGINAQQT